MQSTNALPRDTLNLLLVEDNEDDWLLTRSMLGKIRDGKQYNLEWVSTYDAALQAISEKPFDACLVDLQLGDRDGLDLIRQASEIKHYLPFILLTGRDDHLIDEAAMASGVADYLVKNQVTAALLERAIRYGVEHKRIEERLTILADFDPLTRLANRSQFQRKLKQELAVSQRTGRSLVIMFLDLDHFKQINDNIGHTVGDHLLKKVAARLQDCCRETDTVARLGGDEFAIVAPHFNDQLAVGAVAEKIIEALSQPFDIDGHTVHTGVSIGITVFPSDEDNMERLLANADMAMYRAKAEGRNTYRFYDANLNEEIKQRRRLERELARSLERGEITAHYQPQFDIASGRMTGVEALARWIRPGQEEVPPSEFIPIAETTGLINRLGEYMLRIACTDCRAWQRMGLADIGVAVNISPAQFRRAEFVTSILNILQGCDLEPHNLEIELTEATVTEDINEAAAALHQLRDAGVRVAIDDFGTGYSSLGNLKNFPVDRLKIDQSFVAGVDSELGDQAITRAIIRLGAGLGMDVTAEGVERREQLDFFASANCGSAQGYHLAHPMPFEELIAAAKGPPTRFGEETSASL